MAGLYALVPSLQNAQPGACLELDEDESRHLVRVRRARRGDAVQLLDGAGWRAQASLTDSGNRRTTVQICGLEQVPRPTVPLLLAQAVPKGKAMEEVVRHATEVGVSEIVPLWTHHGEVRLDARRAATKRDRWEEIAREACKQSGNPWLPVVREPLALRDWLARAEGTDALRVLASLEPGAVNLAGLLRAVEQQTPIWFLVGPEGDFSKDEYTGLRTAGFRACRLGAHVLRSETAALYGLSVLDQLRQRGRA